MKLGKYFKEMCINQNEFARKVGVTAATISNIVAQKNDVHLAIAIRIEDVTEGKVTCRDILNVKSLKILEERSKSFKKQRDLDE